MTEIEKMEYFRTEILNRKTIHRVRKFLKMSTVLTEAQKAELYQVYVTNYSPPPQTKLFVRDMMVDLGLYVKYKALLDSLDEMGRETFDLAQDINFEHTLTKLLMQQFNEEETFNIKEYIANSITEINGKSKIS